MKKIIDEQFKGGRRLITECEDCKDELEIFIGAGQVIIDINVKHWKLLNRIKHAFGYIFNPKVYQEGATLWLSPKRFDKLIKMLAKKDENCTCSDNKCLSCNIKDGD